MYSSWTVGRRHPWEAPSRYLRAVLSVDRPQRDPQLDDPVTRVQPADEEIVSAAF
jgi:hypothetical protein